MPQFVVPWPTVQTPLETTRVLVCLAIVRQDNRRNNRVMISTNVESHPAFVGTMPRVPTSQVASDVGATMDLLEVHRLVPQTHAPWLVMALLAVPIRDVRIRHHRSVNVYRDMPETQTSLVPILMSAKFLTFVPIQRNASICQEVLNA